ncbi:MAG: hypothetical protein QXL01_00300 [Thermoplasmatales archaeon]
MISLNHFVLLPINEAIMPPQKDGDYTVFINRYWETYKGNLMFYMGGSPQCNINKRVMEEMKHPELPTEIVFIERVFVPTSYDGVNLPYGEEERLFDSDAGAE